MAVSASPVSRGVRARRTRVLVNHASQILVICAVTCASFRHQQFLSLTAGQMRILNNLRGGAGGSWLSSTQYNEGGGRNVGSDVSDENAVN